MEKVSLVDDGRRKCLNIGSGIDYKPSTDTEHWINLDKNPGVAPDVVGDLMDLRKLFDADTFDEVHLVHVLEHCPDSIAVMELIWAVMKRGGKLITVVPYFTSENAFADPTHVRVITPITFAFFSYPVYEANAKNRSRMSQLFPECDFDVKRRVLVPMNNASDFKDQDFAIKHYFNCVDEMQVEMECVKPIRRFDIKQYQDRGEK